MASLTNNKPSPTKARLVARNAKKAEAAAMNAQAQQRQGKESSVKSSESNNFDEVGDCEATEQAGKLNKFVTEMKTNMHYVMQLKGANALFMNDGESNAMSAVTRLKEEGYDITLIDLNFHELCGGQGFEAVQSGNVQSRTLQPYGEPPNENDVCAFDYDSWMYNQGNSRSGVPCGFNYFEVAPESKESFVKIQKFMECTAEEHNNSSQDSSGHYEIERGNNIVIFSLDSVGSAFVNVVGAVDESIAPFEFPDAEVIYDIIKKGFSTSPNLAQWIKWIEPDD